MFKLFGEPFDGICDAVFFTVVFYGGILLVGFLMNLLEQFFIKGLTKAFNAKVALFICNRITWLGVVIHEYSHAFFGYLFGAKITKVRTLEVFKGNELGHVEFVTQGNAMHQAFQFTFIACAPTLVGLILLYLFIFVLWVNVVFFWQYIIYSFVIFAIICHMSMSSVDVKHYVKGLKWVVPLSLCIAYLIRVLCVKFLI